MFQSFENRINNNLGCNTSFATPSTTPYGWSERYVYNGEKYDSYYKWGYWEKEKNEEERNPVITTEKEEKRLDTINENIQRIRKRAKLKANNIIKKHDAGKKAMEISNANNTGKTAPENDEEKEKSPEEKAEEEKKGENNKKRIKKRNPASKKKLISRIISKNIARNKNLQWGKKTGEKKRSIFKVATINPDRFSSRDEKDRVLDYCRKKKN